jgi:hypothetical protein
LLSIGCGDKMKWISTLILFSVWTLLAQSPDPQRIHSENEILDLEANTLSEVLVISGGHYFLRSPLSSGLQNQTLFYQGYASPEDWRLGRYQPWLSGKPKYSHSAIKTGNEAGDPLFQELRESDVATQNRTPMQEFLIYSPNHELGRVFVQHRQVDHFSQRFMPIRKNTLEPNRRPFAWFGENYPLYSLISTGYQVGTPCQNLNLFYANSYYWDQSPGSLRLQPFEVQSLQTHLVWGYVNLSYIRDHYTRGDLSDTQTHPVQHKTLMTLKGLSLTDNSKIKSAVETGFLMTHNESINNTGYLYPEELDVVPLLQLHIKYQGLGLGGIHYRNNRFWSVSDTLSYDYPKKKYNMRAAVHYDGTSGALNPNAALAELHDGDTLFLFARRPHQRSSILIQGDYALAKSKVQMGVNSWVQKDAWYFQPDSFAQGTAVTLRHGQFQNNPDYISGIQVKSGLESVLTRRLHTGIDVLVEKTVTTDYSRPEYIPPGFSSGLWLRYQFPSGLTWVQTANYKESYRINGYSRESFRSEPQWTYNLELTQSFFDESLKLRTSMLDFAANDNPDLPGAQLSRFRILVGVDWMY